MHRLMLTLVALALIGCAPNFAPPPLTTPAADTTVRRLHVATSRTSAQLGSIFGEKRSQDLRYAWVDVGIPPVHVPGQVEATRGAPNPSEHFTIAAFDELAGPTAFHRSVASGAHGASDEVVLFVHGYNTTVPKAVFRLAQMAHDFEIEAPVTLFSWPSAGRLKGYVYDRDSVAFSRDDLESVIRELALGPQPRTITLVGHSMGTYLVMETLRQIAIQGDRRLLDRLNLVALMSPDIDPDVFRRQVEAIGTLPQPFFILASSKDRALGISSFLTGNRNRLGRITDPGEVAGLGVTLIDFSDVSDGRNLDHLVPVSSPSAIAFMRKAAEQIGDGRTNFGNYVLAGAP